MILLEEAEKGGPALKVKVSSPNHKTPLTLKHEEVQQLMEVSMVSKYNAGRSGDVAGVKIDIQDGKASHKMSNMGVSRIIDLLNAYPKCNAIMDSEETRSIHTLGPDFKGSIAHYKLWNGDVIIPSSSFSVAFAFPKKS